MSTTERYFTLSVICLLVDCTTDSVRVTKKNIQIVEAGLAGNGSKGLSCNYYFLNKKVELLFIISYYY